MTKLLLRALSKATFVTVIILMSMHAEDYICINIFNKRNLKGRDTLRDLGTNGGIILKQMLTKLDYTDVD